MLRGGSSCWKLLLKQGGSGEDPELLPAPPMDGAQEEALQRVPRAPQSAGSASWAANRCEGKPSDPCDHHDLTRESRCRLPSTRHCLAPQTCQGQSPSHRNPLCWSPLVSVAEMLERRAPQPAGEVSGSQPPLCSLGLSLPPSLPYSPAAGAVPAPGSAGSPCFLLFPQLCPV